MTELNELYCAVDYSVHYIRTVTYDNKFIVIQNTQKDNKTPANMKVVYEV